MIAAVSADELHNAIDGVVGAIATMVERAPSPARRMPRSEWTILQGGAHLAISQELFAGTVDGAGHPYGDRSAEAFAAVNARLLADAAGLEAPELSGRMRIATAAFLRNVAAAPGDRLFDSPMGQMPVLTLMSYCLCHLLAHGHSIAVATQAVSPLETTDCRLAMPFLEHAAPISYRMQPHRIRARLRFRIRRGPRFILSYDDDATMQGDDGRPVDVTVSIEAAAMLRIAFGLENQWRAMARGALLAWGRRPWVALQAKGLMPSL